MTRIRPLAGRLLAAAAAATVLASATAAWPAPPLSASPEGQLVILSSALREEFAGSTALALSRLTPAEERVLVDAGAMTTPLARGRWSGLIAASTQFARFRGDVAETVWWNPLADAGLVVAWRRGPDRWRLTAAAPFTGEALRGAPVPGGADLPAALRAASMATRAAVASGAAERALAAPATPQAVIARAEALDREFARSGSVGGSRIAVADLMLVRTPMPAVQGEAGDLGRYLAAMPGEARLRLAPYARLADAEGESMVWGSSALPNTLVVLRYPAAAPRALTPASIDVVDLIAGDQP